MALSDAIDERTRPGPGVELTACGGPNLIIDAADDGQPMPNKFVVVDRARFERIAALAESAYEWINAPYSQPIAGEVEAVLAKAVDALKPGDLDPLP